MHRYPALLTLAALLIGCGARHGENSEVSPAGNAGVSTEVLRLEREYLAAAVGGAPSRPGLVADDAIIHNPDGSVQTGAQMNADTKSGKVVFDSLQAETMDVRVLGPDAALVHGVARVRGRVMPEGGGAAQDIGGRYRFMDVWQRSGGEWRLVAEHATAIHER